MYTRYSGTPTKKFGRPSFGSKPKPRFGGASKFTTTRSRGGRRPARGEHIDFAKFVRKAEPVADAKPYVSEHTFGDFPFSSKLHENILKKGFIHPTPIQDKTIPTVIEGRDLFGLANTGTGKTGAFLLPLIDRVYKDINQCVLILAPTRELALQIEEEFRGLAHGLGIFSVAVVGGMPINRQIQALRRGVSFVIGTPGRVKDLIEQRELDLSTCTNIVLDEADRMLDMGFRDDMVSIIGRCAKPRQTLFFSATMSPEIKKLSADFLVNPMHTSVVTHDTSKNVDQDVIRVKNADEKIQQLHDILIADGSDKVLIFRETKRNVDKLESELQKRGFKVAGIHGDKRNRERIRTLENFKNNTINILIATDVAARGLDIPNVTHVINYDIPQTYDTYVHRIGRTGRAGKKGTALTFVG